MKSEDKKAFKKFIIIMVVAMFIGGTIGGLSSFIEGNIANHIAVTLARSLHDISSIADLILLIFGCITVSILYYQARRQFKQWDGEDELVLNRIEIKIGHAMMIVSIILVVAYFFFAVGSSGGPDQNMRLIEDWFHLPPLVGYFTIFLGSFIGVAIFMLVAQQKLVNFLKEINPEKAGSIFDMKFAKKWEDSCDEAEKLAIYKSAYKAYQTMNMMCVILWLFCVLGSYTWDFGILPVAMVTVLWLTLVVSYCLEAIKLSKLKK